MSITGLDLRARTRRRLVLGIDRLLALLGEAPTEPTVTPEPVVASPAPAPAKPAPAPAPAKPAPAAAPAAETPLQPLPALPPVLKASSARALTRPPPLEVRAPAAPKAKPAAPRPEPKAAPEAPAAEEAPRAEAEKPAAKKRRPSRAKAKPEAAAPTPEPSKVESAPEPAESADDKQARHWKRTREGILRFVHESGGQASLADLHAHSESRYFVAHRGFSRLMEELTDEELLAYDHDTGVATITEAGRAEVL